MDYISHKINKKGYFYVWRTIKKIKIITKLKLG